MRSVARQYSPPITTLGVGCVHTLQYFGRAELNDQDLSYTRTGFDARSRRVLTAAACKVEPEAKANLVRELEAPLSGPEDRLPASD